MKKLNTNNSHIKNIRIISNSQRNKVGMSAMVFNSKALLVYSFALILGSGVFGGYLLTRHNSSKAATPYYYTPAGITNPPSTMYVGQTAEVTFMLRNDGTATWRGEGVSQPVRIGTSNANDHISVFSSNDGRWIGSNRVKMQQASVAPGQVGTFVFTVTAKNVGTYKEDFNLVKDGLVWFPSRGIYFSVNIVSPPPPSPSVGSTSGTGATSAISVSDIFDEPFKNSALRRMARGIGYDSNSTAYIDKLIGITGNINSKRGPSIFTTGEKRYKSSASDPLWTFTAGGITSQIHAPKDITDSGGADPTIGIYDTSTNKVVRLYGGDSTPIKFDRTKYIASGSNIGIDNSNDGAPDQGKGTAWNRMSSEGIMIASDKYKLDHRIKFSLGNDILSKTFRAPALGYETKSYGSSIPMGVTICHLWTVAEIDSMQDAAALSGVERSISDSFTEGTSCDRGYGLVAGDGTGAGGFSLYISASELGVTEASLQKSVRMPAGGNTGNPAAKFWSDKTKWRALIPG